MLKQPVAGGVVEQANYFNRKVGRGLVIACAYLRVLVCMCATRPPAPAAAVYLVVPCENPHMFDHAALTDTIGNPGAICAGDRCGGVVITHIHITHISNTFSSIQTGEHAHSATHIC